MRWIKGEYPDAQVIGGNIATGDAAEAVCSVACNACGRCVADAADGLIEMDDGLAVVDYDRIELENPNAVERCPTGAIVWLEGQQFPAMAAEPWSKAS